MSNPVVVYYESDGQMALLHPAKEYLDRYGIQKIAEKDVPEGRPFKIITTDDIPTDRTFRNAWTIDVSELTDGVGQASNLFEDDPDYGSE